MIGDRADSPTPHTHWLARLDPRVKFAWLISVSGLSLLIESTPGLVGLWLFSVLPVVGLRSSPRGWLGLALALLLVVWGTVLSQAIFHPAMETSQVFTLLGPFEVNGWKFPGIRLVQDGALYGLVQSLRLTSMTVAGLCVCLSTSQERLLVSLEALRIPSGLSFMVVMALRFLPTMWEEWRAVRQARRLRGGSPRGGFLGVATWRALRQEVATLEPVLANAVRRANNVAASVTARGFDPLGPRTRAPAASLGGGEWLLAWTCGAICLAVALLKAYVWAVGAQIFAKFWSEAWYHVVQDWL